MRTVKEVLSENRALIVESLIASFGEINLKADMSGLLEKCEQYEEDILSPGINVMAFIDNMISLMKTDRVIATAKSAKNNRSMAGKRASWMDANNFEFDVRTNKYYTLK